MVSRIYILLDVSPAWSRSTVHPEDAAACGGEEIAQFPHDFSQAWTACAIELADLVKSCVACYPVNVNSSSLIQFSCPSTERLLLS